MSMVGKITTILLLITGFVFAGPASAAKPFDHKYTCLSGIYSQYIKNERVNYSSLSLHDELLDECVKSVRKVKEKEYEAFSLDQKRAYWINAYNLFLLKIIADHYPIKGDGRYSKFPANSPMSIEGAWTDIKFKSPVGKVTLSRIENNILPKLGEPLFIFGICNGTKGAAPLSPEVFTADNLQAKLERAAKKYMRDAGNVSVDPSGSRIVVNCYLKNHTDLFESDFFKRGQYINRDKKEITLMNLLIKYGDPKVAKILRSNRFEFTWTEMDWSLNDIL